MVPSNISPVEFFKYYCTDDNAERFYSEATKEMSDLQLDNDKLINREEILEEQLYFAKELIDMIEQIVDNNTRAKDLKKGILAAIENSYFER